MLKIIIHQNFHIVRREGFIVIYILVVNIAQLSQAEFFCEFLTVFMYDQPLYHLHREIAGRLVAKEQRRIHYLSEFVDQGNRFTRCIQDLKRSVPEKSARIVFSEQIVADFFHIVAIDNSSQVFIISTALKFCVHLIDIAIKNLLAVRLWQQLFIQHIVITG